jgi:hexosaminidase
VGFEAEDAVITIEFARPLSVKEISTRYLRDQSVWIFHPTRVKYELSSDGISFHSAFETDLKTASTSRNNEADILTISAKLPTATPARFLRVTAQNVAACPIWHPGAGGKAWVFMDEVTVNGR